jgi:hypothetical protein
VVKTGKIPGFKKLKKKKAPKIRTGKVKAY